jgi:hypothetical protein
MKIFRPNEKPKSMCLFCYVEREIPPPYFDSQVKFDHKWYCWIFRLYYKLTGKKII